MIHVIVKNDFLLKEFEMVPPNPSFAFYWDVSKAKGKEILAFLIQVSWQSKETLMCTVAVLSRLKQMKIVQSNTFSLFSLARAGSDDTEPATGTK